MKHKELERIERKVVEVRKEPLDAPQFTLAEVEYLLQLLHDKVELSLRKGRRRR